MKLQPRTRFTITGTNNNTTHTLIMEKKEIKMPKEITTLAQFEEWVEQVNQEVDELNGDD